MEQYKFILYDLFTLLVFSLVISFPLQAQDKHTISGYVKDAESGESLIGANIAVRELQKGTTTNQYGFFSITVEEGIYTVTISYLGYAPEEKTVELTKDIRLNTELKRKSIVSEEVVITGEKEDENVQDTKMGTTELPVEKVKTLPVLFGEVDILKTVQLLPGVQSAGEGNAGFYVRGGGPDQNLILLDEAVVYNVSHLFGFFSVFNADALKNVTLIKGGMPAEYGGRLSSVLDINMKEGNDKSYHAEGGLGILASRMTVEGPIIKNKSSFIVSGRRTYTELIMKPLTKGTSFEGLSYYFYDLNAKLNYRFSDKDWLFMSGYFGRDIFHFSSGEDGFFSLRMPWGNSTGTIRWNHLFNDKMFMNATAIYTKYTFESNISLDQWDVLFFSGIEDYNLKLDFDYFPSILHKVKFGGMYTFHKFTPSTVSAQINDTLSLETSQVSEKYAHEAALYIQDEWEINDKFMVNAGLRYSFFQHVGPYKQLIFNDAQTNIVDSVTYDPGEPIKSYHGIEPRLSIRYLINPVSSVKAAVTKNNQYIHLVSNSASTLPTDLWVPSSVLVEPQTGIQYALGYFRNFKDNMFETSVEVYYKDMENQIQFKEGYTPGLDREVELDFVFGDGWSYGAEFFLKKSRGDLNGWVGYTLSRTMHKFPDLNNGEPFPAKYDRRHDLSAVVSYRLNKRWGFAGTFVYGTGNAFTVPSGRYIVEGNILFDYEEINGFRLSPYHRLDLSATLYSGEAKKFDWYLVFAVYNVYNRANPFFIYTDVQGHPLSGNATIVAKQVSLFPILPSITWNFKI